MAITEYYVDPSLDSNTGTGTIGDPFGDLQFGLDTVTRDATNGDRFNIKDSATEVIVSSLDFSLYGTASPAAPLRFEGYTSAAGDGGIGRMSTTSFIVNNQNYDNVTFTNLEMFGDGTNSLLFQLDDNIGFFNCEIYGTSIVGSLISIDNDCYVYNCHLHDFGRNAIIALLNARIYNNYIDSKSGVPVSTLNRCIFIDSDDGIVANNIINCNSESHRGIYLDSGVDYTKVTNNSILGTANNTVSGIDTFGTSISSIITNNLVEGFSGIGGQGVSFGNLDPVIFRNNAFFNNTIDFPAFPTGSQIVNSFGNESLIASPFAKNGANTFANRLEYFKPVDTGNVVNGADNNFTKGAVQALVGGAPPSGGTSYYIVGL